MIYDHQKVLTPQAGLRFALGFRWHRAWRQAMLLGAQARFAEITGDTGSGWMENVGSNDYGNRQNIGYGRKFGLLKPQYSPSTTATRARTSGTVAIKTAAAAN